MFTYVTCEFCEQGCLNSSALFLLTLYNLCDEHAWALHKFYQEHMLQEATKRIPLLLVWKNSCPSIKRIITKDPTLLWNENEGVLQEPSCHPQLRFRVSNANNPKWPHTLQISSRVSRAVSPAGRPSGLAGLFGRQNQDGVKYSWTQMSQSGLCWWTAGKTISFSSRIRNKVGAEQQVMSLGISDPLTAQ